ncbi:hypothetical protein [Candidatus Tisiphia endosymbiont of Nemotelus uliginosus]|uniref:hypothetical protein n=1 Tax=Candidatus Tisiphia endosymbiont of Nemotelus uliginosus TaxID=3077926 RepID=UPI0035C9193C
MSTGDYTTTPSTITYVEWANFFQKLQQRNVTDKEDLDFMHKALIIGESSGISGSLSRSTSEILLNLYHDDKALFDRV